MAIGAFIVSRITGDIPDINFQVNPQGPKPTPEEQLNLKSQVEKTLLTIKIVLSKEKERFDQYFAPLLSLAQAGLVGPHAQPGIAIRALKELQNEILALEGGRIKNSYMKYLGKCAIGLSLLPLAAAILVPSENNTFPNFLLLWVGCMAGVWLSFGIRKTIFSFEDLQVLEKDRLDPCIRLVFSGLLTQILGFMFFKKVIEVNIGTVSTNLIASDPIIALLIGALLGISEKTLPSKVSQEAQKFLKGS